MLTSGVKTSRSCSVSTRAESPPLVGCAASASTLVAPTMTRWFSKAPTEPRSSHNADFARLPGAASLALSDVMPKDLVPQPLVWIHLAGFSMRPEWIDIDDAGDDLEVSLAPWPTPPSMLT